MKLKMKNKWRNFYKQEDLIFYVVILGYLLFHMVILPSGDDLHRIQLYSSVSYGEVLRQTIDFCTEVSPRYFIYFVVNTLIYIKGGFIIWKIMDCVMIFILMKSLSYLFVKNKKLNIVVALLDRKSVV